MKDREFERRLKAFQNDIFDEDDRPLNYRMDNPELAILEEESEQEALEERARQIWDIIDDLENHPLYGQIKERCGDEYITGNPHVGLLKIQVYSKHKNHPVEDASIYVHLHYGDSSVELCDLKTDENGLVELIPLPAPSNSPSITPDDEANSIAAYDVEVYHDDYVDKLMHADIMEGFTSILNVPMEEKEEHAEEGEG